MRNKIMLFCLLIIGVIAFITACDDDTSPVIQEEKEFLIIGAVSMRPWLEIHGDIWSINGTEPDIDSIKFADSTCSMFKGFSHIQGHEYHYQFGYYNYEDSQRFESGDYATLNIYRGSETTTTDVKMLTFPEDSVNVISYPDSVGVNEEITFEWNKVDNADWYSMYLTYIYETPSSPPNEVDYYYESTADTTYTISIPHGNNGFIRMYLRAITGPLPDDPGNIESASMTGVMYCFASSWMPVGYSVTIGSGLSYGVSDGEIIHPPKHETWVEDLYFSSGNSNK